MAFERDEKLAASAREDLVVRQGKERHLAQAMLTQQAHIHGGSQRHQSLVRANVGGGFFAADVLLAGGEGQNITLASLLIHRFTHQPAGQFADKFLAGGKNAQVRAAKGKRDAQGLAFANHDIRAEFTRRFEQPQGERIHCHP